MAIREEQFFAFFAEARFAKKRKPWTITDRPNKRQ
jgi:hypothetical protein